MSKNPNFKCFVGPRYSSKFVPNIPLFYYITDFLKDEKGAKNKEL